MQKTVSPVQRAQNDDKATAQTKPKTPRPPFKVRLRQTMQKWHLWSSLMVGLFLVVVTTSGTAVLYEREINEATHPGLYHVTAGPQIGLDNAQKRVLAQYPGWKVNYSVAKPGRPYLFYTENIKDGSQYMNVYADPGTGKVNGGVVPEHTVMGWLSRLHTSLLAGEIKFNYPKWFPVWLHTLIGDTLSDLLMKTTALALMVMVLSGAYIWWPKAGQWKKAWQIRRTPNQYLRDLDWHKVVGAAALPFLFMWALTGMNFYEPFRPAIQSIWYAVTFAGKPAEDKPLHSVVQAGKPALTAEQARAIAKRTLPDATFIAYGTPTAKDDPIYVWMTRGMDANSQSEWPSNITLVMDAYSGKILQNSATQPQSLGATLYNNWFFGMHTGNFVPWQVRLLWGFFGLTPLLLAFTGVRMWWHKRVSKAAGAKKKAARTVPARPPRTSPAAPTLTAGVIEDSSLKG